MKLELLSTNVGSLQGPYHHAVPPLMRDLPDSRFDKIKRRWTFYATPAGCHKLIGELANVGLDLDIDAALEQAAQRWASRVERLDALRMADGDFPMAQPEGLRTRLWRHQRKAFHFAKDEDAAGLAMFMGTGKSLTTLALLCHWRSQRILIACPKAVIGVWRRETEKHAPGVFRTICLDKGAGAMKAVHVRNAVKLYRGPTVVVANYESIITPALSKEMLTHEWDAVIADESHRLKGVGTKTSKTLYALGKQSKKRLALSGTMMTQGPIDLYGQFRFLDAGVFGTSATRFRDKYCITNSAMPHVILGYKNQADLKSRFEQMAIVVTLDDADLDLPPLTHERVEIKLDPATQKIHDSIMRDSVAKFGDIDAAIDALIDDDKTHRVTAGNILVQLLRLNQVTGGYVTDDDEKITRLSDEKKQALKEIVEDLPSQEPIVVFCRFREDIRIVSEVAAEAGKRYGEISGARKDLTPHSTLPTDVDLVAVQWQSGGAGIDLSRASYGVVYSSTYSGGDFNQGISRLHRPGQTRPTKFYHLVCTGTVDEKIYKALDRKKKLIERITSNGDYA